MQLQGLDSIDALWSCKSSQNIGFSVWILDLETLQNVKSETGFTQSVTPYNFPYPPHMIEYLIGLQLHISFLQYAKCK